MVDPWRVAQIAVERGPGHDGSRGSGYLIAPGRVLTAAHVVAGASVVRVRLDVGQDTEVDVQAESWWADPEGYDGTDLAVVTISEDATAGRECEPTRFGRISDCAAILRVDTFGFPLFKLRATPGGADEPRVFRDFEQAGGHAPVAANRRQGTLAVYLDDPDVKETRPEDPSPWEGMSGGPVWVAGWIVAVVAEHHPSEGTGRLTARRIDRAYEVLSAFDLGVFVELLGLTASASGLPDVVPVEQGQVVRAAYLEQVREIAPDALIGRDSELAEWAEFCAGPKSYAWWQAGPWSGKSALASWFVTHPPAGVDIVSFFITGRLAGQADSDAFLDAMIEQLSALGPVGGQSPPLTGARVGVWLSLLAGAATRAEERAPRLVVVVDGLDEDEAGASPPRGRPSIASLLPRRPPPGARFIITSRPDPGLPDDVPSGHPLRTCIPRRLAVSWVAEDVGRRAKQELRDLFTGDQIAIDVVGYIAGAGGGLTRSDLSALTRAPPHKLDSVLRGVFGRSLETRAPTGLLNTEASPPTRVYLFAHETLRVTAEEQLGSELARYRQEIHDWIGSYASQGWPDITPGYAIRGYPRLLTVTSDDLRLSALARDPCRHAFLLRATGNDYAALTELRNAQRLIAAQSVPDLQALVELAVYRHAISIRNQYIPVGLPAVWARLARFNHAEALTRMITDPDTRAQALTELATAAARTGDLDRAEAVARAITDPGVQTEALAELATAAAQAGDLDRAEAVARAITDPGVQAEALAGLAAAAAQAGDSERASRLAADAEAVARAITDPGVQAQALAELATAAAHAGDLDRASRLAAKAEVLARAITNPREQARAFAELATVAAHAGDLDRAEALARAITNRSAQVRALGGLATAAARAGDLDRASRLAAKAEALARAITDPGDRAEALGGLATAAAHAGDLDRAQHLTSAAEDRAR
jgi:Trypsin-like peptidase domain